MIAVVRHRGGTMEKTRVESRGSVLRLTRRSYRGSESSCGVYKTWQNPVIRPGRPLARKVRYKLSHNTKIITTTIYMFFFISYTCSLRT